MLQGTHLPIVTAQRQLCVPSVQVSTVSTPSGDTKTRTDFRHPQSDFFDFATTCPLTISVPSALNPRTSSDADVSFGGNTTEKLRLRVFSPLTPNAWRVQVPASSHTSTSAIPGVTLITPSGSAHLASHDEHPDALAAGRIATPTVATRRRSNRTLRTVTERIVPGLERLCKGRPAT